MAVFCYLVADEKTKEGVLIDPAGDHRAIESVVAKHGITIKYIINTHGHFDHTSGNDYWMKKTGASLLIHEADARKLGSLTSRFFSRTMGGKTSPPPQMTLKDGDVITHRLRAAQGHRDAGPFGRKHLPVHAGAYIHRRHPFHRGDGPHRSA